MKFVHQTLLIGLTAFPFLVPPLARGQNVQLPESQKKTALELFATKAGATAAVGKPKHLVAAVAVPAPTVDAPGRTIARLMHWDYGTGKTIVTEMDLSARKILSTKEQAAYPTPLSPEERALAVTIARRKNPNVEALYMANAESVKTEFLTPVEIDEKSPKYAQRIVNITFYVQKGSEPPGKSEKVEVNLSETPPQAAVQGRGEELFAAAIENITGIEEQHFPADQPEAQEKSRWKVEYGLGTHFTHGEILYIKSASFRQGPEKLWLKILGDCRIAEIFVPYNGGSPRFYDISMGFGLAPLTEAVLGPACLGPRKVLHDRIAREVRDAGTLWLDHRFSPVRSVRDQDLQLWSAFAAGNYVYIIKYSFGADGSVGFHLGATAHNFYDHKQDSSTHLHMGTWRLNVDLGNQAANKVQSVRWLSSTGGPAAQTSIELFKNGSEGSMPWVANEFTNLRIESTTERNTHNPTSYVAYDLLPSRAGVPRIPEKWAREEFWVTLPESASGVPQWTPADLPSYTAEPRSVAGKTAVIWYHSGLIHSARDEDYGTNGYHSNEGVATTAWTGFKLKPRNLHPSTPHYP